MDGEALKIIRKGYHLTQAEMAAKLEVSRQSYIAWEADRYAIPQRVVDALTNGNEHFEPLVPKETDKQRAAREAAEAHLVAFWVKSYRNTRCWPDIPNHAAAMRLYATQGHVIPPIAYAAIVAEFPDILTDPTGDHAMTKEQSHATLGIAPTTEE